MENNYGFALALHMLSSYWLKIAKIQLALSQLYLQY